MAINAPKQETSLARVTKDETVNAVMTRVAELQDQGRLRFPPNYSPENALMSAYLTLQQTVNRDKKPVLTACTKESVANTLLDMVVQGLNPGKKQCYFIAYGPQLLCQRSYFGTMAVAKRVTGAKEIYAEVVYAGDVFKFAIKRGNTIIVEHVRELKNIDKAKIVAAYCTVVVPDNDEPYTQVMTIDQIHEAWRKSQNSPFDEKGQVKSFSVHGQFAEEMAKKTVVNRTCKALINSSMDDSLGLVVESVNRMDDAAEEAEFADEVAQNANAGVIDAEYIEAPVEQQTPSAPSAEAEKPATKTAGKRQPEPEF